MFWPYNDIISFCKPISLDAIPIVILKCKLKIYSVALQLQTYRCAVNNNNYINILCVYIIYNCANICTIFRCLLTRYFGTMNGIINSERGRHDISTVSCYMATYTHWDTQVSYLRFSSNFFRNIKSQSLFQTL